MKVATLNISATKNNLLLTKDTQPFGITVLFIKMPKFKVLPFFEWKKKSVQKIMPNSHTKKNYQECKDNTRFSCLQNKLR